MRKIVIIFWLTSDGVLTTCWQFTDTPLTDTRLTGRLTSDFLQAACEGGQWSHPHLKDVDGDAEVTDAAAVVTGGGGLLARCLSHSPV